jgi:hypothetical protein
MITTQYLLLLYGLSFSFINSEAWQGIIPATSRRTEVRRTLGNPKQILRKGCWETFETKDDKIDVFYACFAFQRPFRLGEKKITSHTVLRVIVTPIKQIDLSDLNLDLSNFVETFGDVPGDISYSDQKLGLTIRTGNGKVRNYVYYSQELNDKITVSLRKSGVN